MTILSSHVLGARGALLDLPTATSGSSNWLPESRRTRLTGQGSGAEVQPIFQATGCRRPTPSLIESNLLD